MAGKPRYSNAPAAPINQWVRDAIAHAGLTFPAMANALTAAGLGRNYDRSTVQKMTVSRGVLAEETAAIATITGYPPLGAEPRVPALDRYKDLEPQDQAVVDALIDRLWARRASGS